VTRVGIVGQGQQGVSDDDGGSGAGVPPGTLPRPRLDGLLQDVPGRRIVTVVADAGFGKSTLLASWARRVPCASLTVTAGHRGLAAMAAGLAGALRARIPDLQDVLTTDLPGPGEPDAEEEVAARALACAAALADGVEAHVRGDVVLVLDDLHEVAATDPGARLVDGLVRLAPPSLRLVLASRTRVPCRLERLRGRGEVFDVDHTALAFTEEETAALLAASGGGADRDGRPEGVRALAGMLHAAVRGWPAATRLAAEALRAVPAADREARLRRVLRPDGPVYDYLAEEVFAAMPAPVRDLVARVAALPHFSAPLCEALGIDLAGVALHALDARGLLTDEAGGGQHLHPLIREFALHRMPLPAADAAEVAAASGHWFAATGEYRAAIGCLLAAGREDTRHLDAVADLLVAHGRDLIGQAHAEVVLAAVAALGPDRGGVEAIELVAGEAREAMGDWAGALACFARAGGDGDVGAAVAWRTGRLHHLAGRLDEAVAAYARGRVDGSHLHDEALLQAWRASAHWLRGDLEECRALSAAALTAAEAAGDDGALAAAHTARAMLAAVESDPRANEAHYARALAHAERAHDVLAAVRIRINSSSRQVGQGQYTAAVAQLDVAIPLADLTGFATYRGIARSNRGEALFGLGRLDEAFAELETARALLTRAESRFVAHPLSVLGEVYRQRGDRAMARSCFEEAIGVAEAESDAQALVPSLAGLARTVLDEDPDRAGELARRAVAYGPVTGQPVALLALGWVQLNAGDPAAAITTAEQSAELSRRRRDRARLADALELIAEAVDAGGGSPGADGDEDTAEGLLLEALGIRREIGDVLGEARADLLLARRTPGPAGQDLAARARQRFLALGAARYAAAALQAGGRAVEQTVRVECLGGFRVLREGRAVPVSEWPSRKARDLLKILIARRGHPVPRGQLCTLLWPEEDEGAVSARLSVALSGLRAVLDPARAHPSDRFVAGDRSAVWINGGALSVDVRDFLRDALAGLAGSGAALAAAEAAYAGDFLEEDPYSDWSVALREEARATYLRVARALATAAAAAGERDAAVGYLLRILQRDPYDERAHLALVATLAAGGAHGEARRAYRAYAARMDELGVEPVGFPAQHRPASEGGLKAG
jgi:ATP/maltotriose-dependent transcriptional regulator MalT/DNA-binding SARP family transcriptional activator